MPMPKNLAFENATNSDGIVVSVCVITYNHNQYIAHCLDSVLTQECNFPFEVVVRDDCSTDATKTIIQAYARRYPNLIRVLDGSENVGANRNLLKVFAHARGSYIALCEGDDYWTDRTKLQVQIDLMRQDSAITFCSHACRLHGRDGLGQVAFVKGHGPSVSSSCADVLSVSGQFAPTASYVFAKSVVPSLPEWFGDAPVGDFFLEMYAIVAGTGLHINKAMSAYRVNSEQSWSAITNERHAARLFSFSQNMTTCLLAMAATSTFESVDFSRKLAASQFNTAIGALLIANDVAFDAAIAECWRQQRWMSISQCVLYWTRKRPTLARAFYKLKRGRLLKR